MKDYKLKQSWKKVYAQNPELVPGTLRTYHMNNEEETEIEKEDMVEGRGRCVLMFNLFCVVFLSYYLTVSGKSCRFKRLLL